MAILNFGSLNIDHVYRVPHFVRPGETLGSEGYQQFSGGKGSNQSIALARAGADVLHAGKLGRDGAWLKSRLDECGVDTRHIELVDGPSGHAIIQVNREGENAIILHGGANHAISEADAERVLADFGPSDILLLQNEITSIPAIMRRAAEKGMKIVFNPAPMSRAVTSYPLETVDCFILNEIEAEGLTGESGDGAVIAALHRRFKGARVVLTLGSRGARYSEGGDILDVPAEKVKVVDTTAAGDTFIGYFLAEQAAGSDVAQALKRACRAAAVCVTRNGASDSIPRREELD